MSDSFDNFCNQVRATLAADPGPTGREKVRALLEGLLHDRDFIARECGTGAAPGIRTLYRDKETGFNVLVHIYAQGKSGPPHDHGPSWAVYGQVAAWTDMTVWKRKDDGARDGFADVIPERSFRLEPGMAGLFEPGTIHSIRFPDGASFVRVTGTDLDAIPTRRFDPENKTVSVGSRL